MCIITSHKQIIDQWQSRADFCRAIDVNYNRARQWYDRDRIPSPYWVDVVKACHEMDLPVTFKLMAELVDTHKKTPTIAG